MRVHFAKRRRQNVDDILHLGMKIKEILWKLLDKTGFDYMR